MPSTQEYCSRSVNSNQTGLHIKLDALVHKHINTLYQKPIQLHNRQAFERFLDCVENQQYQSLILDSCCGTGLSTIRLALQNPDKLVIGVDQSESRLVRQNDGFNVPDNCLWLRANCEDFWRLCVGQKVEFEKHYILYPNPWPKSDHLKRRWHGHPVFPVLKQLSPVTELRSNWLIYLQEFGRAWELLTGNLNQVNRYTFEQPLTLFEKKYAASNQELYQLICKVGQ